MYFYFCETLSTFVHDFWHMEHTPFWCRVYSVWSHGFSYKCTPVCSLYYLNFCVKLSEHTCSCFFTYIDTLVLFLYTLISMWYKLNTHVHVLISAFNGFYSKYRWYALKCLIYDYVYWSIKCISFCLHQNLQEYFFLEVKRR